jgi:hypothetical protein
MGVLTEANYYSRRLSRQRDIDAAQERYNGTAFALELGDATREDVAAAKLDLDELRDRLAALDAAWAKRKDQITGEAEAAERAARRQAHSEATKLLTKRIKAAVALEKAAKALGDAYEANGKEIVAAVAPVARHLGRDGMVFLREDATGRFSSPAFLLAGLLKSHGIDFAGIDVDAARFRVKDIGIAAHVEAHNVNIERRVRDLLPGDSE